MTKRIGNVTFLYKENDQQCDLCGKIAELRPYGPNGECICFECGMKDEKATEQQFETLLTTKIEPIPAQEEK